MLNQAVLTQLKNTIRKYLPENAYQAFIFGSRATGTHRKFSDIDVGILGKNPVKGSSFVNIQADLEDSDLPYRVDLVDFTQVTDKFKQSALNNAVYL